MEYAYLHPNYFNIDQNIYDYLDITCDQKFFLLRFVSWSALHDQGHSGLDLATRRILVSNLLSYGKVFISSEGSLDAEFEPFRLTLPPELVHSCLAAADLFIAESGTMASESAILGTPVIYVNSLPLMGYLREEENQGLLFHFKNSVGVVNKATELVEGNYKQCSGALAEKLLHNKIDVTKFMVWLVENYPESKKILSDNPQYQYNFL
jgi:predicted glycosyltransferase